MRRASSYPCSFCAYTAEKRTTAQTHLLVEHLDDLLRLAHRRGMKIEYSAGRGGIQAHVKKSTRRQGK